MDGGLRILIVGGGYGGMHTALRLERLLRPGEATVTVTDPRSYMTYQPLLAEAAAGNLEPRQVVVRCAVPCTVPKSSRTSGTRFTSSPPRRLTWHPSQTGKREADQHAYHR